MAPPDTTQQTPDNAVSVVNETGDPMATIVVESAEPAWTGYAEGDEPDGGNEYLRVVVTVQNDQIDDSSSVNVDHFIVQDANGFIAQAQSVKTAEESDTDADVISEADLNSGEGVELALVFEITTGVDAQRLYYRPADDRLIDVANLT